MADEDPWAFDEGDTTTTDQATTDAPKGDAAGGEEAVPAGGEQAAPTGEGGEQPSEEQKPPPPPEDDGYRKPVQLYRHWVRPKYLQYKYIYDYRTNYYDDVIDYLDKKQSGFNREIPRPQTWAERVLRTSAKSGRSYDYVPSKRDDKHLIQVLAASIRTHNYHTKAYLNQKYSNII